MSGSNPKEISTLTRKEAMEMAAKTGHTAVLLKGQVAIVPESAIQRMLSEKTPFAFLRCYGGVITAVPMN